jgi:signal transduction histidine kinase
VGRRKDGSEVSVEVVFSSIARESGALVVYFVTDVSARRAADRRIAEYQEKLRQMAFDAAIAEERERRRIAADLHDRIGQALALSQMKLKSVQTGAGESRLVAEAIDLLGQSIVDTRTLIFDLSPPILYELGLEHALSWLAEDLGKRSGIQIEIQDDRAPKPLGEAPRGLVFRAVRELLTNVAKHSQAPAATVSLRRSGNQVEIDVQDRGIGFDPDAMSPSARDGFGLFSVREQISRLGGTVEVQSAAQLGTRVRLRLPLEADDAAPGELT